VAPSKEQIEAAIDALRQGGLKWEQHADGMQGASAAARALNLGPFELSALASLTGLAETYGLLQEKLVMLLQQGSVNFDAIGGAIKAAANGYEEDERDAVHRARGIY